MQVQLPCLVELRGDSVAESTTRAGSGRSCGAAALPAGMPCPSPMLTSDVAHQHMLPCVCVCVWQACVALSARCN